MECYFLDVAFYILHFNYNLFIINLSTKIYKLWIRIMNQHGSIKIKLEELIQIKGISKNKLCHKAEMERTQLNNFCKNNVTRLDTDVLARLCHALDCSISDLLEFVPPEKEPQDQ